MAPFTGERTKIQFQPEYAFVKRFCNVVLGFVSCILRVWNYNAGEPARRTKLEARAKEFKNVNAAIKDESARDMIKCGYHLVMDWIWRLSNMTFKSGVVPANWRFAVIVLLSQGKGERNECRKYRGISL